MAFVPGFRHDVFVSYAHGDDRRWVEALQDGLQEAVRELVGAPIDVYLDKDDLALKNSKFAFRCPILPIPENDHWALLEGLTDIPFHNAQGKFAMNSADYDRAFREHRVGDEAKEP